MSKRNFYQINKFTKEQLLFFKRELKKAGGFDNLMMRKQGLRMMRNAKYIALFPDIQSYKEMFLTGVYEPLREEYNTEVPYVFWSRLRDVLISMGHELPL